MHFVLILCSCAEWRLKTKTEPRTWSVTWSSPRKIRCYFWISDRSTGRQDLHTQSDAQLNLQLWVVAMPLPEYHRYSLGMSSLGCWCAIMRFSLKHAKVVMGWGRSACALSQRVLVGRLTTLFLTSANVEVKSGTHHVLVSRPSTSLTRLRKTTDSNLSTDLQV